MKIVELLNNVQIGITNEQADLLGRFQHEQTLSKKDLNEREQVIANQLTTQDILLRRNDNGQIIYQKKRNLRIKYIIHIFKIIIFKITIFKIIIFIIIIFKIQHII